MKRIGIIVLTALIACTAVPSLADQASPAPTTAPSGAPSTAPAATPTPDPAIVARAKSLFKMLQTGKLDRAQLSDQANSGITDATMTQAAAQLGPLGDPVTFEQEKTGQREGSNLYLYLLTFGNGAKLAFVVGINAAGKITALGVQKAQ